MVVSWWILSRQRQPTTNRTGQALSNWQRISWDTFMGFLRFRGTDSFRLLYLHMAWHSSVLLLLLLLVWISYLVRGRLQNYHHCNVSCPFEANFFACSCHCNMSDCNIIFPVQNIQFWSFSGALSCFRQLNIHWQAVQCNDIIDSCKQWPIRLSAGLLILPLLSSQPLYEAQIETFMD